MPTISRRSAGKLIAAGAIAVPAAGLMSKTVAAIEPNMQQALNDLMDAHTALEHAVPNKAGHRERALRLVEQAINEVRAGIAVSGG
ncbi:MAG TPA: hypothetical protein VGZ72_08825 [Stellaceae bacterium]|jgi:hypothetical protein|nr:hypothetical protein [Stellaceae bacterium]